MLLSLQVWCNVGVCSTSQEEVSLFCGNHALTLAIAVEINGFTCHWGHERPNFSHRKSGKSRRLEEKSYLSNLLSHLSSRRQWGHSSCTSSTPFSLFQGLAPEAWSLASGWAVLRITKHKGRFSIVHISKAHLLAERRRRVNGRPSVWLTSSHHAVLILIKMKWIQVCKIPTLTLHPVVHLVGCSS